MKKLLLALLFLLPGVAHAQQGTALPGLVGLPKGFIGCQFNTTLPTIGNGASSLIQCDSSGILLQDLSKISGSALALGQTTMSASLPVAIASNQSNLPNNLTQVAGNNVTTATTGMLKIGIADASGNALNSTSNALNVNLSSVTGTPSFNISQWGATNVLTGGSNGSVGVGGLAAAGAATVGNPVLVAGSDGTDARDLSTDASGNINTNLAHDVCGSLTKTSVAISQTANAKLFSKVSAKKNYICSIVVVGSDAENLSLIEGTQTTNPCDTTPAAIIGSTTAANGVNLAANGGFALGNGSSTVANGTNANFDVCLFQSGTGRVAGVLTYVQN